MSRMTRPQAEALLLGHAHEALAFTLKVAVTPEAALRQAQEMAQGKLNREARRALGLRGDGAYHPAITTKDVVRTRNA